MLTNPLSLSNTLNCVLDASNTVEAESNVVPVFMSPPLEVTANVEPSKSSLLPNLVLGVLSIGLKVCLY